MNYNIFPFFQNINPILLFVILAWSLYWKGMALWKAAHKNDKNWFVAILIINLVGILEILYIYIFSERKPKIVVEKEEKK